MRRTPLDWCLEEHDRFAGQQVPAERVARYFAACERKGHLLGLRSGNFCAAAQCYAESVSDALARPYRAGARELMVDAKDADRWLPVERVRLGILPPPGALAIYWRKSLLDWRGHVQRVVSCEEDHFNAVGANEGGRFGLGGCWRLSTVPLSHPQLLGFCA